MRKVAIVGTAGRMRCMAGRDEKDFKIMFDDAAARIQTMPRPVQLISGGAAWADHIAVELFLFKHVESLWLYLPAPIHVGGRFWEDSMDKDGRTSNFYHEQFSRQVYHQDFSFNMTPGSTRGIASVFRILDAHRSGAHVFVNTQGFKARNSDIAKAAEHELIAYTWGRGDSPQDGGTRDTWDKSRAIVKTHVSLHTLLPRCSVSFSSSAQPGE